MAENSKIEWTHHTFNPWTGCQKVGPGCDRCYAEGWEPMQSVRDELRQMIAMSYRLWVEGDQVHGLPPVAPEYQEAPAYSLAFPDPICCTAWEDCQHDGICHDPHGCGAIGPNQLPGVRDE